MLETDEKNSLMCCYIFFFIIVVDKTRSTDGPPPFEFETDGHCGNDWKIWLRGFEIYAQANKMNKATEKLNWMLHYAGTKVQTIFYAMPEKETKAEQNGGNQRGPLAGGYVKNDTNDYEEAIIQLNQFFEPKQNISYERHIFRQLKQKENERIDMFIMRLREQAERCDFGDQLDGNIRDQITSGCSSDVLRRKILERGDEQLENIIKIARILEVVTKQQKLFGKSNVDQTNTEIRSNESDVCKIDVKTRFPMRQRKIATGFNGECGRCGLKGHKAADEKCPAKGKSCNSCGRKDHFARKCFCG